MILNNLTKNLRKVDKLQTNMYTIMMINLQDSQEMNSITPKMLDRRQSLFTSPSFKRKKNQ